MEIALNTIFTLGTWTEDLQPFHLETVIISDTNA